MAEFGVQAWDAAGVLTMDSPFRPGRVHGSFTQTAPVSAGSLTVPSLAQGSPFWQVLQQGDTYYDRIAISLSGTTFSWSSGSFGFTVYYGTF